MQQQAAGPLTQAAFQTAVRVARRIANETAIHPRRVGVPGVAVGDFAPAVGRPPSSPVRKDLSAMRKSASHAIQFLGSLKLAVVVLLSLAVVLALATFLEAAKGRDYARWYVYEKPWFVALLGLLALNILAAAVLRFPWKKSQIPFVVTHAGLLVLLAGAMQTLGGGIDGVLALEEKETGDKIRLARFQPLPGGMDGTATTGRPSAGGLPFSAGSARLVR